MSSKSTVKLIIFLVLIAAILGVGYWLYMLKTHPAALPTSPTNGSGGFAPLSRSGISGQTSSSTSNYKTTNNGGVAQQTNPIPVLRLLSDTPVGGYGASTTASTTLVRWIDRGRGNIYEAKGNTLAIATLSNTLLPKVYNSIWNKAITAFIGPTIQGDSETPTYIYAELNNQAIAPAATSTRSIQTLTPFSLKGRSLPSNTIGYAVSPQKDKLFTLVQDTNGSVGYVSNFDGTKTAQIFTTPLTQFNVDWPSTNIITLINKGTADRASYLYFVDPKTGVWKKVIGPMNGLSAKVSVDGKKVFFSASGNNSDIVSGIYNVASSTMMDVVLRTLAEKCVWGNFYKDVVYCAVPFQNFPGTYPDDWYRGTVSTIDKVWQVNSVTGETKLVAPIIGQADRVIDMFNLGIDDKDNFLFFMNKNDLSLWSLDLVRSH